jgi:hypothetical protein
VCIPNPVHELRAAVKERGHSDLSHASTTQGLQGDAEAQIHYIKAPVHGRAQHYRNGIPEGIPGTTLRLLEWQNPVQN